MTEVLAFVEGPIGIFVLAKLLKKSGLSGGPTTDDFLGRRRGGCGSFANIIKIRAFEGLLLRRLGTYFCRNGYWCTQKQGRNPIEDMDFCLKAKHKSTMRC